jgi:large subunit ribosomal protein L22
MIITATQKYTRQTPRKLRLVANTVKKMSIEQAIKQLGVIERKAALAIMKTLKQAMANAMNNHGLAFKDLAIKNITVGEGPRYRRFNPVSRGRAHEILKKTSHITVTLMTTDEVTKPAAPVAEVSAPTPKVVAPTKAKTAAPKKETKKVAKQ